MNLAITINREATTATTRVLPGTIMLTLYRYTTAGPRTFLRLEMSPAEARTLGVNLFADASKAEEIAENSDGGRWDGRRVPV